MPGQQHQRPNTERIVHVLRTPALGRQIGGAFVRRQRVDPPMSLESKLSRDVKAGQDYPSYRSHYLPRTRRGWIAVLLFLVLLTLAQPPIVHTVVNRIEPRVFGIPFLYAYLLLVYCCLIAVLLWARRRGL